MRKCRTASPVRFVVVTCHDFPRRDDGERGHLIYPAMEKLRPHFLVHAGDIEYYDKPGPFAKSAELARYKWNRLYSLKNHSPEHRFLRIKGGFLSVEVGRIDDQPRISLRHHDVRGEVVHEEIFSTPAPTPPCH